LVTTDVGGLGLYLGSQGVYRYDVGSPDSLVATLRELFTIAASGATTASDRQFIARAGLTADDYAARFALVTQSLLSGDPPTEVAELAIPYRDYLSSRQPGGGLVH
jgi:hypothetical protein